MSSSYPLRLFLFCALPVNFGESVAYSADRRGCGLRLFLHIEGGWVRLLHAIGKGRGLQIRWSALRLLGHSAAINIEYHPWPVRSGILGAGRERTTIRRCIRRTNLPVCRTFATQEDGGPH